MQRFDGLAIRPVLAGQTDSRVFRSTRSLKLVYAMKSVTQSRNVCHARYGDPVDIFSCNIFFPWNPMCSMEKKSFRNFPFLNRHISRDKRFPFQCVRFRHFAKAFALQNQGKMTKRNSFHSIFWLQLPDVAKYCRGYVLMALDHWNASAMRLGHILSITNIIQVLWTRITPTKLHFQGSGETLRNPLVFRTKLAA